MGLVVPLHFPAKSQRPERRPSTMAAIVSATSSGTTGPPCAAEPPRPDRSSPP